MIKKLFIFIITFLLILGGTNMSIAKSNDWNNVEGANHVDLYDNLEKIPFDKIEKFFTTYLKENR